MTIEERLKNSITFLKAMHLQANQSKDKMVYFDIETIEILLKLLNDVSKEQP